MSSAYTSSVRPLSYSYTPIIAPHIPPSSLCSVNLCITLTTRWILARVEGCVTGSTYHPSSTCGRRGSGGRGIYLHVSVLYILNSACVSLFVVHTRYRACGRCSLAFYPLFRLVSSTSALRCPCRLSHHVW